MKAKKLAILLGIGATFMASAPSMATFADSVQHVSNSSSNVKTIKTGGRKNKANTLKEKVLGTGTVRFEDLAYTYVVSGPSWQSNYVATLYNGTNVNIVGESGGWYEIQCGDKNAWIMKSRVNTLMGTSRINTGVIDFSQLNYTDIMTGPSWYSGHITTLNNGTNVEIIGEEDNWYQIKYDGGEAWVLKDRVNTSHQEVLGTGTVRFEDLDYTYVVSGPSWQSDYVATLYNGENVNIVGESGGWYEIECGNRNAWIMKSRVNTLMGTSLINTGVINFNELSYTDIMTGPSWYSGHITTLNNGTNVDIIGEEGNWYQIKYDGGEAWVLKDRVNTCHKPVLGTGTVRFDDLGYTYVVSGPSWQSDYVATLYNGTNVNIIGESGNWYEIESNNQTSWIMKSRVNTLYGSEDVREGIIDFKDLGYTDILTNPQWGSSIITILNNGTKVKVIGESNGWDRLDYQGGEAWVPSDRVATEREWNLQQEVTPAQKINQIINYGEQFIGTPYEWGGESPSGFDCSGLVQYVFAHNGINLPRTTEAQQQCGVPVAPGDLEPGDLVFWGEPAYHVAIYIGNGQILVAPHTGTTVTIMNLYPYTNARRII
ncbi:MAG: SH3 domain-containing protein [Clostridium sp.]